MVGIFPNRVGQIALGGMLAEQHDEASNPPRASSILNAAGEALTVPNCWKRSGLAFNMAKGDDALLHYLSAGHYRGWRSTTWRMGMRCPDGGGRCRVTGRGREDKVRVLVSRFSGLVY